MRNVFVAAAVVLLAGCPATEKPDSPPDSALEPPPVAPAASPAPPATPKYQPPALTDAARTVAGANNALGYSLFGRVNANDNNLMISPHSIGTMLALLLPGARGETLTEMKKVLGRPGNAAVDAVASSVLDAVLAGRAEIDVEWNDYANESPSYRKYLEQQMEGFELEISNGLWTQRGYPFEPAFLNLSRKRRGAVLRELDFSADPEGARGIINKTIDKQTRGLIPDLVPLGGTTKKTRMFLTNAVYFKARWSRPFESTFTKDAPFRRLKGGKTTVKMMHASRYFDYVSASGVRAVRLPYNGDDIAMWVVMPKRYRNFEKSFDAAAFEKIVASAKSTWLDLGLPRFTFGSQLRLADHLRAMGMSRAMQLGRAEFSGVSKAEGIALSAVFHKSKVILNEWGTVAAAASGGGVAGGMPPKPIPFVVDRPFLFVIQDKPSGAILFLGRVLDPSAG